MLITGPGGVGKTTLAHALARRIGCPVVSRDEIKEGMAAATPDFVPAVSDPLTMRTYDVFFAVVRLLLENQVTLVAEAAFQHDRWEAPLKNLRPLAHLRVVRCQVAADVRLLRAERRRQDDRTRAAHDDAGYFSADAPFTAIRVDAPTLDVDTADGYRPDLDAIVSFVTTAAVPPADRCG